mmetsp:Transcript_46744/g.111292  ORF Transcript_46744/g.111292 Transcript_46744/m.111292 type:complete len:311 (-) Transcript_46744:1086-2018(-)
MQRALGDRDDSTRRRGGTVLAPGLGAVALALPDDAHQGAERQQHRPEPQDKKHHHVEENIRVFNRQHLENLLACRERAVALGFRLRARGVRAVLVLQAPQLQAPVLRHRVQFESPLDRRDVLDPVEVDGDALGVDEHPREDHQRQDQRRRHHEDDAKIREERRDEHSNTDARVGVANVDRAEEDEVVATVLEPHRPVQDADLDDREDDARHGELRQHFCDEERRCVVHSERLLALEDNHLKTEDGQHPEGGVHHVHCEEEERARARLHPRLRVRGVEVDKRDDQPDRTHLSALRAEAHRVSDDVAEGACH